MEVASLSQIQFDPSEPENSLLRLVHYSDLHPIQLSEIPKSFVDEYGIPSLACALNLISTPPPVFDQEKVDKIMDITFVSLDQLIQVVSSFELEIEKLYAIYYYGCHHIQYDKNLLSGRRERPTLQGVFDTGFAQCEGYSFFFS
jgi:hypothetical protein